MPFKSICPEQWMCWYETTSKVVPWNSKDVLSWFVNPMTYFDATMNSKLLGVASSIDHAKGHPRGTRGARGIPESMNWWASSTTVSARLGEATACRSLFLIRKRWRTYTGGKDELNQLVMGSLVLFFFATCLPVYMGTGMHVDLVSDICVRKNI